MFVRTRFFAFWTLLVILLPASASPDSKSPISDREGVSVIGWREARECLGHKAIVEGQIVTTKDIGNICFLNFDAARNNAFTVIIRSTCYGRFASDPATLYRGKFVRVFGTMTEYKDTPQIEVFGPDQIEVIDEKPLPPAEPAKPVKVVPVGEELALVSFNVLNLFDAEDDPYRDDDGTPVKPRIELEHLAETIRKLDADVLALQEVENRGYLERFVRVLLPDMGYREIVHFEGNDNRGIDCSVLSRVPVGAVTSYRHMVFANPEGGTMRFRRDLLRVELMPGTPNAFDLFVVHLKSKAGGEETDGVRVGEARAARAILDRLLDANPRARFAICGDFNDLWDSNSVLQIRGNGERELKCFADEIPESERITYNEEPYRSMIDFIFCSPAMAETYIPQSYSILHGAVDTTGSDHNPVSARFRLN